MLDLVKSFQVRSATLLIVALSVSAARAINQEAPAPPPGYLAHASGSPVIGEVMRLLDAKVDAEVIKAYVHNCRTSIHLTAADIIALKDRGAPSDVLTAMLEHQAQPSVAVAPPAQTVTPPATPSYGTAVPPAYPSYGYADAGYSDPYYYPSYYYPSYYGYGGPSFYFSSYWPYCYGGYYGGYGRYCYPSHYYSSWGHGIHAYGSGSHFVAGHSGGFHASAGGFHGGSAGFHTSGGFHGGGGGFHASGGSGGHSGGHR